MLILVLCYINLIYTQQLSLLYKKRNQTKKKAKKVFKPGGSSLLSEPPDKNGGRNE